MISLTQETKGAKTFQLDIPEYAHFLLLTTGPLEKLNNFKLHIIICEKEVIIFIWLHFYEKINRFKHMKPLD